MPMNRGNDGELPTTDPTTISEVQNQPSESNAPKRLAKVIRFRILKPADTLTWKQLDKTLKDTRYRVFRLGNLAVSEAYLNFHLFRTGRAETLKTRTFGQLSRDLREMLVQDKQMTEEENARFSPTGALPDSIVGALSQYKIGALKSPSKWRDVIRGKSALPTFRLDMAIPIRCDKAGQRRLDRQENKDVHVELMITRKPYPRVVLQTGDVGGSARAILDRLLDNPNQSLDSYRQRLFEVKQDRISGKWWLSITYDFPAVPVKLKEDVVVGVDLGVSCPLYVALNNGHARLGRRQFGPLGARIRVLQNQVMSRRRSMLRGGARGMSDDSARSGHGRNRKLASIGRLEGRIEKAYTTLNHQLSAAVIRFAQTHGAGVIQIEDLEGLKAVLLGTYIGARWRYHQLQSFLTYKAAALGIILQKVNPRYTSRRCSECGHIHLEFDRARRDELGREGFIARFKCPQCSYESDPDYNAARNIATLDIAKVIQAQCKRQGIALSQEDHEAADNGSASPLGNRGRAAEAGPAPAEG